VREDKVPDIIILDYNLGNLTGVSTLQQIMAYKPDLEVILLSGQSEVDVAVLSIKKGAREYIIKEDGALDKLLTVIKEIETEMARKKDSKPVKKLFGKVKDFLMDNE
jgi:DNA-binding NtrC family response regulator